jgi:hypothetical protein
MPNLFIANYEAAIGRYNKLHQIQFKPSAEFRGVTVAIRISGRRGLKTEPSIIPY